MSEITKRWESYRDHVYGEVELSETQERECARAFYSGMMSAFVDLLEISSDMESREDATEKVEAFRRELMETALANLKMEGPEEKK